MYWIIERLGTASLPELEAVKKLKDIEVVLVRDLKDGKQKSKGQLESKVRKVEEVIKKGKKAVIICVGGMSRSNAVALAYLVKTGMGFDEAYNLIRKKVPIAQINMDLIDHIRKTMGLNKKISYFKPKRKKPSKYDLMLRRMETDSQKAIKRCSCKKCGGIIVTGYASSLMASSRERCKCKKPLRQKNGR